VVSLRSLLLGVMFFSLSQGVILFTLLLDWAWACFYSYLESSPTFWASFCSGTILSLLTLSLWLFNGLPALAVGAAARLRNSTFWFKLFTKPFLSSAGRRKFYEPLTLTNESFIFFSRTFSCDLSTWEYFSMIRSSSWSEDAEMNSWIGNFMPFLPGRVLAKGSLSGE